MLLFRGTIFVVWHYFWSYFFDMLLFLEAICYSKFLYKTNH